MASFPALFSGVVTLYPVTQGERRPVGILQFSDFTEQRFRKSAPLARFVLTLEDLKEADRITIETFFDSVRGGFDSTWDITLDGATYSHMAFETDTMEQKQVAGNLWSVSLPCRQVRKN